MIDITSTLNDLSFFIGSYSVFLSYFSVFFVLTLCGLGLPIPEDIVLITAGLLVYNGNADMINMIIICLVGVIFGDYIIFSVGRKWGLKFLNHRIFGNTFSQIRMEKVHKYFDKYGDKTIFFGRFIWGLRAATFFIAGTHTMSVFRFIAFDFLGALISVPLIIYLAHYFGGEIQNALDVVKHANDTIIAVSIVAILYFLIRHHMRKKTAAAQKKS